VLENELISKVFRCLDDLRQFVKVKLKQLPTCEVVYTSRIGSVIVLYMQF